MVLRPEQDEGSSPPYFEPLPEGKSRWGKFLAAIVVECVVVLLISIIPATRYPPITQDTQLSELFFHPAPVVKKVTPPAPGIRVRPRRIRTVVPPVLPTPVLPAPRAKLAPKHVHMRKAPVLKPEFHAIAPPPAPVHHALERPQPPIHVGVLSTAVDRPKQTRTTRRLVQTGGFGDPDGVKATGEAHHGMTVPTVGSFDSPVGPGSGNGTGGRRGARGQIAQAGFGDAIAKPRQSQKAQPGESVHAGVFSNQAAVPAKSAPVHHAAKPSIQPVRILVKPNPAYTAEARAHKIEGNVILEVIFTANGTVDVLRVVRGLGYGLDQSAISAARRIRFRPERVDGKPVDARARLRIVFRLAY